MTSFRVEPPMLQALAGDFGDLIETFEAAVLGGLDLTNTGDSSLTNAIEHFAQQSHDGLGELVKQFGQLQKILIDSADEYAAADDHVATEIDKSMAPSTHSSNGSVEGNQVS